MDVLHGVFQLQPNTQLTWRHQPIHFLMLAIAVISVVFGTAQAAGRLLHYHTSSATGDPVTQMVLPLVVGAVLSLYVLRHSDGYVCWPELCPELLPRLPPWHSSKQSSLGSKQQKKMAGEGTSTPAKKVQ